MKKINAFVIFALFTLSVDAALPPDNTQLSVWANEAIVATYTYDYQNFLQRQKEIAKYFTAEGWTAYSAAVFSSKLPDTIQTNSYYVSAVATLPPTITPAGSDQWEAKMPLLVVYKNPQYQQKQTLNVTIRFIQAASGQGVRGFAITSLQSQVSEPTCQCQPSDSDVSTTNVQQPPPNAK